MNRFSVAMKLSRRWVLVFLAALVLAEAGGSSAVAAEPGPSLAVLEALLFSDVDCALPTGDAQFKGNLDFTNCSTYCGYAGCRGMIIDGECTTSTGAPGTCSGPSLGKKCVDGLPMCVCVAS